MVFVEASPMMAHSKKYGCLYIVCANLQFMVVLVWKMWFQFAMWCIQHDLMQIKSISSKTTSHEQNLLSQNYKSLLQWRNPAKNMKFEKLWEPGQEKMHWKEVLNYYPWFCGDMKYEFKAPFRHSFLSFYPDFILIQIKSR